MCLKEVMAGLLLLFLAQPCFSRTTDLRPLASQLTQVRSTHGANTDRDAGSELNSVKDALRAWVEGQLPPVPGQDPSGIIYSLDPDDLTSLAADLNHALDQAKLTCGRVGSMDYRCGGNSAANEDDRGYVDHVRVARLDGDRYLLVITGVGIECGFDQSAYVYAQGPNRKWHLMLAIEQDRYGQNDYKPQNFLSIDVSPSGKAWNEAAPPPLVVALGYSPWCSSSWQALYTRLWRASEKTTTPTPLLDRDDILFIGDDSVAAAKLTRDDLLVQFVGQSIDSGISVRPHVLHYRIASGDRLTRIAPAALDPQSFVEEWLTSPVDEALRWIDPNADRASLMRLHLANVRDGLYGEFDAPPKRCRSDPSLWQIAFYSDPDGSGNNERPKYFNVRWTAPYEFLLISASGNASADCDGEVVIPSALGTLFPDQGWKP